jgi:uncharacterized protein (TIGR02145 family)
MGAGSSEWGSLNSGATSWLYNDSATYNCPYGKLYNWYAALDTRNVCPVGWHTPSKVEVDSLILFVDPTYGGGIASNLTAGELKSTGFAWWQSPNFAATNLFGFSALPTGFRDDFGIFSNSGVWGNLWTQTSDGINYSWTYNFTIWDDNVGVGTGHKREGKFIRCLRD